MKRTTKFILLFAALALPPLIYVFLKSFGKNEFEVPVLFQEAVTVPVGCGSYQYPVPYVVPESALTALEWTPNLVNIFVIDNPGSKIVLRLFDEFQGMGFVVREVPAGRRQIAACALLLQPPANTVIVDGTGKIRGQYDIGDLDEVDRLIVEMKIMLLLY